MQPRSDVVANKRWCGFPLPLGISQGLISLTCVLLVNSLALFISPFVCRVDHNERWHTGVGLLKVLQLSCVGVFLVNKKVTFLCLKAGKRSLSLVYANKPNSSEDYSTILESLKGVILGARGPYQPCGQQQWNQPGNLDDWEELLPCSETELCSVFGFLC